MCGRYAITKTAEEISQWFDMDGPPPNFPPHYNAAPGQELPVIRLHPVSGDRVLGLLRWGLIPHGSRDPKIAWKCINARGETLGTTPSFRRAYRTRRCLVPANAFYEWKADGKTKQPYAIALRDRRLLAFAGLWENWQDPTTEQWIRTFTIVTTEPIEIVAPLHDRMPLILEPSDYDHWLDPEHDPTSLIEPYSSKEVVTCRSAHGSTSRRTMMLQYLIVCPHKVQSDLISQDRCTTFGGN
jgi:putative SOS response-associated peptidase YedK